MDDVDYVVRQAGPGDLLALARLLGLDRVLSDADLSAAQVNTWSEMMAMPQLRVYLAEQADEAVGYTATLRMPHLTYDCRPTLFIESMHVLKPHRRRGVATRMLERIVDDAGDAGCHKVQLLSHKRHATDGAHDLYRSVGFMPEAEGFRLYLD